MFTRILSYNKHLAVSQFINPILHNILSQNDLQFNPKLQEQILSTTQIGLHPTLQLSNNSLTATNPSQDSSYQLAFVENIALKKGSSIKFKIQKIGSTVSVGLGIRNSLASKSYKVENFDDMGHGCFLLSLSGYSYSHSVEGHNDVQTGFKSSPGDVIMLETKENAFGDSLQFRNETKNWCFKMRIKMSDERWQQASFCVQLSGNQDSVSILEEIDNSAPTLNNNSKVETDNELGNDCCLIQ